MPSPSVPHPQSKFFFKGQLSHLLSLLALLSCAAMLVDFDQLAQRDLLAVGAHVWFVLALIVPVIHQVYVWLLWRGELCFGAVTGRLGAHAFRLYQTLFMLLFLARPVSLTMVTIADHDSINIPISVRVALGAILGIPAAYTLYSVIRYFGLTRATGIDHFDESYRRKPLVKEGIFKYTNNAMYWFAFLTLWVIAVAGASWAATVVAAFSHVYIWVHYFFTERPDMEILYGSP